MLTFGLSQTLSSLCFVAISVSLLLILSLPAVAEVNSPPMTVLDMGEMSQIAGGGSVCKIVKTVQGRGIGRCRPDKSTCLGNAQCGDSNYTIIFSTEYCQNAQTGGHGCWCEPYGRAWRTYNCKYCDIPTDLNRTGQCVRLLIDYGGQRIRCKVGLECGDI